MAQAEIIERLYYLPNTKAVDLSIILNLSKQSVQNALKRLKKFKMIEMNSEFEYSLTSKGKDFAERYYL